MAVNINQLQLLKSQQAINDMTELAVEFINYCGHKIN